MVKFRVGDVVVRVKDVGLGQSFGTMRGTVIAVFPGKTIGSKQSVRVKWASDSIATHDGGQLARIEEIEGAKHG